MGEFVAGLVVGLALVAVVRALVAAIAARVAAEPADDPDDEDTAATASVDSDQAYWAETDRVIVPDSEYRGYE